MQNTLETHLLSLSICQNFSVLIASLQVTLPSSGVGRHFCMGGYE